MPPISGILTFSMDRSSAAIAEAMTCSGKEKPTIRRYSMPILRISGLSV